MSLAARFPFVPTDLTAFWREITRGVRRPFLLGGPRLPVAYLPLESPVRLVERNRPGGSDPLTALGAALQRSPSSSTVPRFVGVLGYEAGRWFDSGMRRSPLYRDPLQAPVAAFGDYRSVLKIDFIQGWTEIHLAAGSRIPLSDLMRRLQRAWRAQRPRIRRPEPVGVAMPSPQAAEKRRFASMVARAGEAIAAGDIYQANLSLPFSCRARVVPHDLYERLWELNPSPYACLLDAGSGWIVSNSPELLLRVRGRVASTRPIAGTRPRGRNPSDDRRRRGQLLLSPKERAEHIMLVDLERNDLGRVAAPGTVRVSERFSVEPYSHVMHIVSEVECALASGRTSIDALRAVFPGGTITGCPKIRAMEVIAELERVSRGIFYGSAGYFAWNGDAVFNILIRTAFVRSGRAHLRAGAGIVADSLPAREYDEARAKAGAVLQAARGKA